MNQKNEYPKEEAQELLVDFCDIFVTKPFMPPQEVYNLYIQQIWEKGILTNQGPLLREFENTMRAFLQEKHFHFLQNGTISLQLALQALNITEGEIITTPFSYVATSSSILWQKCTPIYVDIEPNHFTIDPLLIEKAITPQTKAIMPVHVFGHACDVEAIEKIAQKYHLKTIYDGAHAFAVKYKNQSLLSYGDISTLSFHTTKLFHTIEGGACIVHDQIAHNKIELMKRFGHTGDSHFMIGINAKNSEFHAAMGLANFPYIDEIIQKRKAISQKYDALLAFSQKLVKPMDQENTLSNYGYYPVLFKDNKTLSQTFEKLKKERIFPRRYFFPSLNTLPYVAYSPCPISENISSRIACLPIYPDLKEHDIIRIANAINSSL